MKQKELKHNIHRILRNDLISNYDCGNIDDGGILGANFAIDSLSSFLKNNCFAIYMSSGSWDDYCDWVKFICFDEIEAKLYCNDYNQRLDLLKNKIMAIIHKDEDNEWDSGNDKNFYRHDKIMSRNHCFYKKADLL